MAELIFIAFQKPLARLILPFNAVMSVIDWPWIGLAGKDSGHRREGQEDDGGRAQLGHGLGCSFPVSSADFWLCLRKFCGQADRGRLAGQRREFKIHRKSTAQVMTLRSNFGIFLSFRP